MRSQYIKRCLVAFSLLAVLGIVVACQKEDDTSGLIEVIAEPMNGAKVLVNGSTGSWVDGDAIRINDEVATVQHRNGSAYISATSQSVNLAVYPASLYDGSLTSDAVTLSFPKIYHYRTDDSGHQLLELPMAACSQSGSQLKFYHLTGALCFTITDTASKPLRLQSITLSSNKYQLNGSRSINFNNLTNNVTPLADEANRSVMMVFDTGYVLSAGETIRVMIPVLPVGNDNVFTVKIRSYDGEEEAFYQSSKTQSTGGNLDRNQLGYVPSKIGVTTPVTSLEEISAKKYSVRTAGEFKLMVKMINEDSDGNKTFWIEDDIDMTGDTIEPMSSFEEVIDGRGHVISNLTIRSKSLSSLSVCALFDNYNYGTISNITLRNLGLYHQGNVSNLYLAGIYATFPEVGDQTINVSNCNVKFGKIKLDGNITGTIYLGGMVANSNNYSFEIESCSVIMQDVSFSKAANMHIGGFIGHAATSKITIRNSSWDGMLDIVSDKYIYFGGLVGYKYKGDFVISNCSVSDTVKLSVASTRKYYLGRLLGFYSFISPSIGDITRNLVVQIRRTTSEEYSAVPLSDYNKQAITRP